MTAPLGVAFCPSPPLLHPLVGVGLEADLGRLRAACHKAVAALLTDDPRTVLVLGGGDASAVHPPDSAGGFAGYGVPVSVGGPGRPTLPLSLTIGSWLLDEARWRGPRALVEVGPAGDLPELDPEVWALLVVGDGSTTRTDKAPGSFHPRAGEFDASVEAALASGDGARLGAIDARLGDDVRAGGVSAWQAAGALLGDTRYVADEPLFVAPYGVGYFAARWERDTTSS